ncbi:collagen-binding domain-containing protein [Microbacterium sp.]|uniref:collagen-binding domain-containing protein n=1 Tax=Microbacterium sp. TaxID=51671 RepID=UPI002D773AEE|nr:collagen-binding domain-containing protein [Microbacterium sp.]HET6302457.1 collagen-binding domain-containing protein [Microbacterium sp.]
MSRISAFSRARTAARTFIGSALAVSLGAGAVALGAAAPAAAAESIDPFSINNGFTVVARGDVVVNNSELEGSIAVFGSISSGKQNGYAVVHKVAGEPDYTVPTIDGVPVRLLAQSFTGSGSFEITNNGAPSAAVPEATASVRLASVDGL